MKTTLVLGGTGKTGRRVVERLEARGLPVRVGSRSGKPPFDWEDPDTWAPALEGVESVYVSYYPDIAIPGAVEAVRAFAERAVGAGVGRLVLLSGRGEEEAQRAEAALQEVANEAGVEWTIVRCAWFMQNFDENYLLEPILSGEVALPSGDVPEPFVDAEDIADVAVAALTGGGHAGGPFELALAEDDVPTEFVSFLTYIYGEVLDGRNVYLTDGVRRAVGREPKDFSD